MEKENKNVMKTYTFEEQIKKEMSQAILLLKTNSRARDKVSKIW